MNQYNKELDNIRASEKFKNNTVRFLTSNPHKKHNKKRFTVINAIAASLAIVIALMILLTPTSDKNNHSFTLTAYAAEIEDNRSSENDLNDKSFITVGKIKDFGTTTEFVTGQVSENGEIEEYPENGSTVASVQHSFVFNMNCKGEDIDTVTYSVQNGLFSVSNACEHVVCTTEESKEYNENASDDSFFCKSFTTKYQDQIWNHEPVFAADKKGNQNDDPIYPRLCLETALYRFDNSEEIPKPVKDFYDYYGDGIHQKSMSITEKKNLYETYMDSLVKDMKVTVTVKFMDGREESNNLVFESEYLDQDSSGAQVALQAKIE